MTVSLMNSRKDILHVYLEGLESRDPVKVQQLFIPSATVVSPLHGEVPLAGFFEQLFGQIDGVKTKVLDTFFSNEREDVAGLHFDAVWRMLGGGEVSFRCFDLFEFQPRQTEVRRLSILFDTRVLFVEQRATANS